MGNHLAVFQHHQTGDAAHTKLRGQLRVFVAVNAEKGSLVGHLIAYFFQHGSQHLARAAPGGVKIQYGYGGGQCSGQIVMMNFLYHREIPPFIVCLSVWAEPG